ncbi:MAG: patatin-like phospholipase family protein [Solirubrobacteraceae bacterium]
MSDIDHSVAATSAVPRRTQSDRYRWAPGGEHDDAGSREPLIAFVLAGGASLGAMQAGMLRALYERGISPDLIVGTSAGALNAAFIASRPQTVATARELAAVWSGLRREDVFPLSPRMVIGGLTKHRAYLVPDTGLRRLAARHLQIERLEHAAIPLHLVAFDLLSGTEVRLSTGPAVPAVLAAAAIPGVLPPVAIGEELLVDGGVVDNTPISQAIALGATRIYVLCTDDLQADGLPVAPRGALDSAVHAFSLLVSTRLRVDLERYASTAELIVLPGANPDHVQPTDFEHSVRLIGQAHQAAHAALDAATTSASRALTPSRA